MLSAESPTRRALGQTVGILLALLVTVVGVSTVAHAGSPAVSAVAVRTPAQPAYSYDSPSQPSTLTSGAAITAAVTRRDSLLPAAASGPLSRTALASGFAAEATAGAGEEAAGQFAYHYTSREAAESIARTGLKADQFATPNGELGSLQAQIELALPYRELPTSAVRIDLQGLQDAGFELPQVTRVASRYGMPGGGWEMQFPYEVPSDFLKIHTNPFLP